MNIDFIKCHGNGNDFVLINETQEILFDKDYDRARFARTISDRKGIVGADGVLFLGNSSMCDYSMRIFNADGSEAEMCGNGIRCIARLASELSNKDKMNIETMNKTYEVNKEKELADYIPTYSVCLNNVTFETVKLPIKINDEHLIDSKIFQLSEDLLFTAIGMPNPHLITEINDDRVIIDELLNNLNAKIIGNKNIFPNGINVSAYKVLKKDELYVRTFERGVGLTYSCGTANCASAIAYILQHIDLNNTWIKIINNGGLSKCLVNKTADIIKVQLLGNATFVYSGEIEYLQEEDKINNVMEGTAYINEIQAFGKLLDQIQNNNAL